MRLQPTCSLLVATFLATLLTSSLRAQTTTSGGLTGIVTDPSGAVIPDTNVEIKDNAKGGVHKSKTDRTGVYRFSFIAPGRIILKIEHTGFRDEDPAWSRDADGNARAAGQRSRRNSAGKPIPY